MNLAGRCESVVENLSECLFQRRLELRTYAANVINRDTNANTQRRPVSDIEIRGTRNNVVLAVGH